MQTTLTAAAETLANKFNGKFAVKIAIECDFQFGVACFDYYAKVIFPGTNVFAIGRGPTAETAIREAELRAHQKMGESRQRLAIEAAQHGLALTEAN